MFVRRSRKGRIHMVRERVKKGYRYISGGLRDANELTQHFAAKVARDLGRGIKETGQEIGIPSRNRVRTLTKGIEQTKDSFNRGVNSVHKSSQLALAKGHQSIQSGLKKIQKNTGDFNMHYQYEPPVAMFSMAEVDKYNRYSDNGMAYFERKALPGKGGSSAGSAKARWQRTSRGIGQGFKSVGRGIGAAAAGAAKGVGSVGGKTADWTGRRLGEGAYKVGQMGDNFAGKAGQKAYGAISKNPRLAGAIALGGLATAGAAGVGGTMFMRRRRSKSGKVIVEQVRR